MKYRVDFEEAKQKRDRGITVKEVLSSAIDADDVIVTFVEDGKLYTTYSSSNDDLTSLIGMLEISKVMILEG